MHGHRWAVYAAALSFFAVLARRADAGWLIEQKVRYHQAGQLSEAAFTWRIDDQGRFRTDVVSSGQTKIFLFNGRVFFGCGNLDKEQLGFLMKLDLKDKALLESLEKGVCEELATDFSLRFFMAPYDAASRVEVAEGFAAKAVLTDSEVSRSGTSESILGLPCGNVERRFLIGDGGRGTAAREVKEKACNATQVAWRTAIAKELGKSLVRQPGGASNYKAMTGDLQKAGGLSLVAASEVSGKDSAGRSFRRTVTLTTLSAKEKGFAPSEFQTPAHFTMLDAQTLALSGKGKTKASVVKLEEQGGSLAEVISFFLRGGHPAGMLVGAP